MTAFVSTSTRPYLIRALYEWCTDNGLTPYVAVSVDNTVQVPREYVKNNEIVLNIGFDATSSLTLGNDFIEFKARFGGSSRDILVPISHVIAIYARENGQGMAFPLDTIGEGAASVNDVQNRLLTEPVLNPLSGLRTSSEAVDSKIMQLVESLPEMQKTDPGKQEKSVTPESPKPPSRPRPSLKRVK